MAPPLLFLSSAEGVPDVSEPVKLWLGKWLEINAGTFWAGLLVLIVFLVWIWFMWHGKKLIESRFEWKKYRTDHDLKVRRFEEQVKDKALKAGRQN